MSQEIWVIGASIRGYFSLFTQNLRCPKRYGLLVHQEGAIFVVHPKSEESQEIWVIGSSRRGYFLKVEGSRTTKKGIICFQRLYKDGGL